MKFSKNVTLILVLAFLLGGCGGKNVEQIAASHTTPYRELPALPGDAEMVMENSFRNSAVEWDPGNLATIRSSRAAIQSMGLFMQQKAQTSGSVPYYSYVASVEYIYNQYMILQRGLDARVQVPGAISAEGALCYELLKQRILAGLSTQRDMITIENGKINDFASEETMDNLRKTYALIKPLLGAVI